MTKLNQIIAVVNGQKTRSQRQLTEIYHQIQKADSFMGLDRRYQTKDEEGEQLPPEQKHLQTRVSSLVQDARAAVEKLWEVVSIQDTTNCRAKVDVELDGQTLAKDVPVTHLLFLEKQLADLSTFVSKLPTLDAGENWTYDDQSDCYRSQPVQTVRTKKMPRSHLMVEASVEHPAQVHVYTEDVQVGTWTTTKFSGGISAKERNQLLERIAAVTDAVKRAREKGNETEADKEGLDKGVLDFIFGK